MVLNTQVRFSPIADEPAAAAEVHAWCIVLFYHLFDPIINTPLINSFMVASSSYLFKQGSFRDLNTVIAAMETSWDDSCKPAEVIDKPLLLRSSWWQSHNIRGTRPPTSGMVSGRALIGPLPSTPQTSFSLLLGNNDPSSHPMAPGNPCPIYLITSSLKYYGFRAFIGSGNRLPIITVLAPAAVPCDIPRIGFHRQ